jgi:hypothetical protein
MDVSITQKSIIDKVKTLNDPDLLEAIDSLLSNSLKRNKVRLSDEQKESITKGRDQIESGDFNSQKDFFSELREWLKEK